MKDVLKYKEYIGSVHYSAEDDVFYGKVMGVDDFITFEGGSVAELKNGFIKAVDEYIRLCESISKPLERSYKGSFNIRISPSLHKRSAHRALELGVSLNQFVELAIIEKLDNNTG